MELHKYLELNLYISVKIQYYTIITTEFSHTILCISLLKDLPKLNIFQGVSQFPIRIKCVLLSWHALKAALK